MKKLIALLTAVFLLLPGCSVQKTPDTGYTKYSAQFYGTFDTVVQIVGYCKTEEEFSRYAGQIKSRMEELSQLYDIYYEYSDENNLKTINDNAGIQPVPVREEILDLIEFCQEWYGKTDGKVNIALGPVLSIWHNYMERYSADPTDAKLPKIESLMEKLPVCNIEDVIVDREAGTVYLAKEGMSLDVGAVAKGYATQLACQEAYDAGFTSFIVSAGGNVVAADPPLDGIRSGWGIGIQDPFTAEELGGGNSIDVAYVNNTCVVTSGDYQRYYMVGKQRVHHIIDPDTLMPAAYYRGVTVIIPDAPEDAQIIQKGENCYEVDGLLPIPELKDLLDIDEVPDEDKDRYTTVAGMVIFLLERLPRTGDRVKWDGWEFRVMVMDGRRLDRILITKLPSADDPKKKES